MREWRSSRPLVTVCVPTFNHEPYVTDCLFGLLSQKTDFPFEILIRDDASSDGTTAVLRRFQSQYPEIVKLMLNKFNEFPNRRPLADLVAQASTDFIAVCEGDDYWIRTDKLQRQVQLLLADNARSVVAHSAANLKSDGIHLPPRQRARREFAQGDMRAIPHMPTLTLMFRRFDLKHEDLNRASFGDIILKSQLCSRGTTLIESEYCAAVYRVHNSGMYNSLSLSEAEQKTLSSRLAASQLLAEQGHRKASSQLFSLAVKDGAKWFQREYGVDLTWKLRRTLNISFSVSNQLRSKWRTSPIAERCYSQLRSWRYPETDG